MGAFCIYGISRSVCRAIADKKTPSEVWEESGGVGGRGYLRALSPAEWAPLRDAMAEKLFAEATRKVRVSPELDSPHFCRDWLAADPSNVRDAVIMVRGPKRDKKGDPIIRNGAPVETWLEYTAECERLKIAPAVVELQAA